MSEKRDPVKVIESIIPLVPISHNLLAARLAKIAEDAAYVAPEAEGITWRALADALNDNLIFPPRTAWEEKILRIIHNEEPTP